MGGRGAGSGYVTYEGKVGARLSPKQFKEALDSEANFILGELKPDLPKQLIIKKDFSRGKAEITIDIATNAEITQELRGEIQNVSAIVESNAKKAAKEQDESRTNSGADVARAKYLLWTGIAKEIQRLKKKFM